MGERGVVGATVVVVAVDAPRGIVASATASGECRARSKYMAAAVVAAGEALPTTMEAGSTLAAVAAVSLA